jgi:hypothetical protein
MWVRKENTVAQGNFMLHQDQDSKALQGHVHCHIQSEKSVDKTENRKKNQ